MEWWIVPLGSIIVALIGAIPGVIALIQQRREVDAKAAKTESEKRKTDAEVAGVIQNIYQDLVEDLKKKSEECKTEISNMSIKIAQVMTQNEELVLQNKVLIKQNEELKLTNDILVVQVEALNTGVKLLISQLEKEGITPEYRIQEK